MYVAKWDALALRCRQQIMITRDNHQKNINRLAHGLNRLVIEVIEQEAEVSDERTSPGISAQPGTC